MVKPVNKRPADEFGNHKLDMDKLDYSDEKVEKAKKASDLAKQLVDMYQNTLIVCTDANVEGNEPLGIGSGLVTSHFKSAHDSREQELILQSIFTSVVENMIEAGMLGKCKAGDHQHAYEFFVKLAGYYAYQFPDNVVDRYYILKQVGMKPKDKMSVEEMKALVAEKTGGNIDDIEIVPAAGMNRSQFKDLLKMLGANPEEVLKKMKWGDKAVEIGHLNLNKMTKGQKESLATLLDINLDKLESKKGKGKREKMTPDKEKNNAINLIQIDFKPEFRSEGLIANQQGLDDIEAFLDDHENIDNGVFEQMWDDDACWEEGGRFAGLGLDRSDDDDFKIAKAMWMDGRHYAAGQISIYGDILKEEMEDNGNKN